MQTKKQKKLIFWGLVLLLVAGFTYVAKQGANDSTPGKYTPLAQCLKEKGAVFYGAWWCPHCEQQLAAFGTAKNDLPYVECSNPDKSQNFTCNAEGIQNYPTWKFPDGTVRTGEQSMEELAKLSGCELPE